MKNKGLKITLYVLIIILISLVSFIGVYRKDDNRFSNIVNEYLLGSNLKGKAVIELKIDDTENEIIYDENGNVVEEVDEENKDKYTTVKEPVNKEEVLNLDNYEKSKEILEKRFNFIKLPYYDIRLNKSNGSMIIETDEAYASDLSTMVSIIAKIDARDSANDELLFDNSNIKNVTANYQTDNSGAVTVYLDIALNSDSKSKIDEIKKKYADVEEAYSKNLNNVAEENVKSESDTEEIKAINLNFDNTLLNEAEFADIIISGNTIKIPVGNSSTSNDRINSYYNTAILVANSINIGQIPVVYTIDSTEYFATDYQYIIDYMIIAILAIIIIVSVYTIIKYKYKGILATISYIAWIAIFLLIIRYTNIEITISSLLSFLVLIVINIYVTNVVVKVSKEDTNYTEILKNSYKKIIDLLAVSIIIFIVFSFTNFYPISSIGLFMFWGVLTIIVNSLITAKILTK